MSDSRSLTEEEIADLKEAFAMFDTDGNGKIDVIQVARLV